MIQIPQIPELVFEEQRHIYKLHGVQIPSVSTIMRPLTNAYYGGIDENVLAAAAKRGRTVHNSIENFLKFSIDDLPPEHEGYYEAFKKWWADKNPTLIATESRVYHKIYRYAGTADLSCTIGGTAICVDFKTTVQIVEMLTRVQLEAYAKAYESHGVKFGGKAIVQLQKDGTYNMAQYAPGDTESWECFCALLTLNNYLKKHGR
jgi:hypothetical protein